MHFSRLLFPVLMRTILPGIAGVAFFVCSQQVHWAGDNFDPLLNRIPATANALMLIDVETVLASPMMNSSGWKTPAGRPALVPPISVIPGASELIVAASLNLNHDFAQTYELALLNLKQPVPLRSIALAEGGYVDVLGANSAVWSPADAYIVDFGKSTLGVIHPANRQLATRWAATSAENPGVSISPYLKNAVGLAGRETPIVLALDLADAVQPHELRSNLEASAVIAGDQEKLKQYEQILYSLQGITVTMSLEPAVTGKLQMDFAIPAGPMQNDFKPMLMTTLQKFGIALDELSQWSVSSAGKALVLEGPLSETGMRKIFSLLEVPTTNFSRNQPAPTTTPEQPSGADQVAAVSQQYFHAISTVLDDMEQEFRTNRDARNSYAAVYMSRYARKIDRLPILNVDPDLLAYGTSVAETLRETSVSTRTAGVSQGVQKAGVYGNYNYAYNGYGYGTRIDSASTKENMKTEIERREQGQARVTRFGNWKEIQDATAAIRVQMTEKYKVQF